MAGFRGNENLKVAGETESISKEELQFRIQELLKCKNDPVYFANQYFKIINLEKGLQQIRLFPKQEELLRFFVENDRCVTLSARQSAKSTTYTIFCLWYTIFFPEKKILLACNKLDTALEIMGRIALAYERLPNWLKPGLTVYNKGELQFSNLSGIKGFATSSSSARGYSANILILDEFAFCLPNVADSFFTSVYPVISSAKGTKIIIVSTPNGVGNLFYNIWQQALNNVRSSTDGKNIVGWKPFKMDWFDFPGRDEAWKTQQIASIGIDRWRQEFGNEFISSSFKKLIPDDKIERFRQELAVFKKNKFPCEDLIIKGQSAEYVAKIWYDFNPDRTYLASADIADGVGRDASVIYIWDITDYTYIKQAAAFYSNTIPVVDFAYVCFKLLSRYYKPVFIAKSNAIGISLNDQLVNIYNYDNFVVLDKHGRVGVQSHVAIKGKACLWMQEFVLTDELSIELHDEALIDEMDSFVKKETTSTRNLTYAAMAQAHDDHIMAMVWGIYALNPEVIVNYYQTVGSVTTKLGKVFPKEIYPSIPYEDIHIDNSQTEINALSLAEQWSKYLQKESDPEFTQASEDYKNIVIEDGIPYQKEEKPETKLEKMVRERRAAQPKAVEEESLLSYGDPFNFKEDPRKKNNMFYIDIGADSSDLDLFFKNKYI